MKILALLLLLSSSNVFARGDLVAHFTISTYATLGAGMLYSEINKDADKWEKAFMGFLVSQCLGLVKEYAIDAHADREDLKYNALGGLAGSFLIIAIDL